MRDERFSKKDQKELIQYLLGKVKEKELMGTWLRIKIKIFLHEN